MKKVFVDTNYFLRFLLKDNLSQQSEVSSLFRSGNEGKVTLVTSILVFFEIYWVLSGGFYGKTKRETISFLRKILQLEFIAIEHRELLQDAIDLYEERAIEFEDCYNIVFARNLKVQEMATFDKKVLKLF